MMKGRKIACSTPDEEHLTLEQHSEILEAVLDNDVSAVERILEATPEKEKSSLLSRHFRFEDGSISHVVHKKCLHLRLLLALALTFGFWQIVEVLLKEGVDVLQQDCFGNNVIHSLIMQVFYHPQLEQTLVDNFQRFIELLQPEQVKTLLLSENMYKVRAVEFAAQHGACRMVLAIMNVPGVHLHKVQSFGTVTYKWYDITEYETAARITKSPLVFMTFVKNKLTMTEGFQQLQTNSFFTKWIDGKFMTNLPIVIVWFAVRLMYVACYFVHDMDIGWYSEHPNSTHCVPTYSLTLERSSNYVIAGVLLVYSACVIIMDVFEAVAMMLSGDWSWVNNVEGCRGVTDHNSFYRYSNLLFAFFVFVTFLLQYVFHEYQNLHNVSRVICPVLGIWSLLYFVQLVPSVGSFVITVQVLLGDLLNFSIIFIIMMIPFMHSFQVIVNSNTNIGCFGEYDTLFQTFYSLFRVMLNMLDLTAYDIDNVNVLLFAHVLYTFTVSIMMINFYIARMSHSVSVVSAHHHIRCRIRRTLIAYVVEWRWRVFYKPLHVWLMKRYFLFENDRIFIVYAESKLDGGIE